MPFDLAQLIQEHQGSQISLLRDYINPRLARVLKTIGFDPVYVRGKGAYLWDDSDRRYLDMLAGFGVFNIGRAHPRIKDAIRQYLELDSPNLVKMGTQLLAGLFARKLVEEVAPRGLDTVFLCNSGTEAVEGALKFARCHTGRQRIVYCEHSYHGLTGGALSINGCSEFQRGFGDGVPGATCVPFDSKEELEEELRKGDVAAFITEPIQGHGVFEPSDDYFPFARNLCDQHGTVFIADEVQTGFGRTGKWFAMEHWGVEPDIMTVSKALSGGFCPIGAILYKREIYNSVFSSLDRCIVHSSTFAQNDLAAVCGMATIEVLRDEKIVENSAEVGEYFRSRLEELVEKHEMIHGVRGRGLLLAVEFGKPRSLKLRAAWKMIHGLNRDLFCQAILMPLIMDHGIIAQVAGHGLDVIKILPTLVITRDDVDYFVEAFDKVVTSAHKFPGPIWEVSTRLFKTTLGRS